MAGLFALEAHGEVRRLVRGRTDQDAVVIDLVAEDILLDGQRNVCHLCGEGELRIGIQNIEFDIAIGKEDLLR